MRRILVMGLLGYWLIALVGCASLGQKAKGFLGISTREIEDVRDKAIVRIVDYDYNSCYRMVEEELSEIEAYVYTRRKDLIAFYMSRTDTTTAGIFFKEIDKQKTQVEVACPVVYKKEQLAGEIFAALGKTMKE